MPHTVIWKHLGTFLLDGIMFISSLQNLSTSFKSDVSQVLTACFKSSHRFSITFQVRRQWWPFHNIVLLPLHDAFVDFQLCFGSLSCWNVQPHKLQLCEWCLNIILKNLLILGWLHPTLDFKGPSPWTSSKEWWTLHQIWQWVADVFLGMQCFLPLCKVLFVMTKTLNYYFISSKLFLPNWIWLI